MTISEPRRYEGIYIPLITPFLPNEDIDWIALKRLVAHYARLGVAGFVPCGSTGEASALTMEEHKAVISFVIEQARRHGKFQIIAATGSGNTRDTVELTRHAKAAGADACLVATPAYVRPNRSGLLTHYERVAEIGIDILLYNIPQRTGLNLGLDDIVVLANAVPHIVGIKEATGDIQQLIEVTHHFANSRQFSVLSGEDSLLFDCCAHGGRGSICAAALVFPREIMAMTEHLRQGRLLQAATLNQLLRPRVKALFCESNPVAMKLAMHYVHGTHTTVRSPLGPASERAHQIIASLRLAREGDTPFEPRLVKAA